MKNKIYILYFIGISIFLITLWMFTLFLTPLIAKYFSIEELSKFGTLGDMFGITNALFSGFALAGIIVSIIIQQKELMYQRQELISTRKEFQITRITNIIYEQLEKIDKLINEHELEYVTTPNHLSGKEKVNGKEAVIFLKQKIIEFNSLLRYKESKKTAESLIYKQSILKIIEDNYLQLHILYEKINSSKLIISIILKNNQSLTQSEKKNLYLIFNGNLGSEVINNFVKLHDFIKEHLKTFKINSENDHYNASNLKELSVTLQSLRQDELT